MPSVERIVEILTKDGNTVVDGATAASIVVDLNPDFLGHDVELLAHHVFETLRAHGIEFGGGASPTEATIEARYNPHDRTSVIEVCGVHDGMLEREAHKDPVHIGDVMVCVAGTENPYIGHSIIGEDRVNLLTNFYLGCLSEDFEVWHAPAGGGARKLEGPHEVNWQSSSIGD